MPHSIHFPILNKLGLAENEALIYELLLERGKSMARDLVTESGLGRGNVYNILTSLQQKGFVLLIEGKQTLFQAVDPSKLRTLSEQKIKEAKQLDAEFQEALSQMSSTFNLSTGRPTIQIFEGLEGFEQAIFDSLNTKNEILTYSDPVTIMKGEFGKINARYVKKRHNLNIPKRIIFPDNESARKLKNEIADELTNVVIAHGFSPGFNTIVEIYDNKVAFLTLREEKIISVIIEDEDIVAMQRNQFEYIWKKEYQAASPTSTDFTDSNAK
ncbi:MAG: Transcriptional regulator, TrmB [uncultured bacterium]|nr:MAG: Transcriptional regulator, TrmB [uncultured bacterium]HBD05417.1 hypothetical protein [Candidatus Uhrbacteria bacterium]